MSTTEIGPELILSSLEAESEELEESVEALTSFLLEAEDLADFEVSSFDELWLARQALQRIHDISLPKKVRKSKNVRDSYEVSAQASEPYDHLYDAVNQAIIRFNQNGSGEQAAENYHEKLDGRPNLTHSVIQQSDYARELHAIIKARGACGGIDPNLFFPSDGKGVEVAKKICRDCPVRNDCLEYALEARIDNGIWGGTSERERRRILKRRRQTAKA